MKFYKLLRFQSEMTLLQNLHVRLLFLASSLIAILTHLLFVVTFGCVYISFELNMIAHAAKVRYNYIKDEKL